MNITDLTTAQLHRIIAIKQKIEKLQSKLGSVAGDNGAGMPSPFPGKRKKRRMSAAGRAAIAAGARARWAKIKGTGATTAKSKPAKKKDQRSSPATRAKLARAAKLRWAKARSEGKKTL